MTSQPDIIIFDLDGTLIDSAPDLHAAMNVALQAIGRQKLDLATVTSFIGHGVEATVRRSVAETGVWTDALQAQALMRFHENYGANMTTLTRPYAGVLSVLATLHAKGCRLGICTNKPEPAALRICDELGLTGYFDAITAAVAGRPKKPDPAPLLQCIAALEGTEKSAVYVGDSGVDFETARNAGVAFRLFRGGYLNADPANFKDVAGFDDWSVQAILPDTGAVQESVVQPRPSH